MHTRIRTLFAFLLSAGTVAHAAGQKPVITVSTVQSSLAEATSTSRTVFTVRSDQILRYSLTVQYGVSGTALAGKDYQALSGSVTIPAGQTSAPITVSPINDAEDELDETVVISVVATSLSPYTTSRPSGGRTTIVDDDNVRIIGLEMAPDTVLGGQTRDLQVTVSGAAPPGGLAVSVASGNTSIVPNAQATIAAGTRVGLARLSTSVVSSTVAVPLTVKEPNGSSMRDTLVVMTEPALRNMNFKFPDNYGGREYTGDVNLESPAPPGGLTIPVTLTLLSPAGAALPASAPSTVTIPGGRSWEWLNIRTQPVSAHTQVEVRAGTGSGSVSRVIDIYPIPEVQSIAVTPDPAPSSDTVDVTVRLAEPIGPRLGYSYDASGSGAVDVPAGTRVRMAYQQQEATIRVAAAAVASPTAATVTVRARDLPGSWSGTFTVNPPALRNMNFKFPDNYGGREYTGDVNLESPAPPGGLTLPVTLTLLSPAGAPLPASAPSTVTIQEGRTWEWLNIGTQPVSEHTRVEVRAGTGSGSVSRVIDIYPVPEVQSITVTPDPAPGSDAVDVTVRLTEPIGPRLGYSYDASGSGAVEVPAGTRVRMDYQQQETTIRLATAAVSSPTPATVTVRARDLPGSWSGTFTVAPPMPLPAIATVSFMSTTMVGGTAADVMVVLTGPVPAGRTLTLNLTATDPVLPPASSAITIPGGQSTATLTVQTREVAQTTEGSLRAEVPGGSTVTGTVTVQPRPVTIESLSLSPSEVEGGDPVSGTIRLSDAAPAGGMVVNLSSSHPTVMNLPASVTVPAGASASNLQVTTSAVGSLVDVRITASTGTGQVQQVVRVNPVPPRLASLTFNPATVATGAQSTGRVDLAAPANAPVAVALSANNPSIQNLPPSVTILAGQTSSTFSITGATVRFPVPVQITASFGGDQLTTTVTVQPPPPPVATSVSASPTSVIGGGEFTLTVTLSRAADKTGMAVPLTSSSPAAIPNVTVQIAGGRQTGSTQVRTSAVGTVRTVRMSTSQPNVQADIQVQPLPINRIQSPGSVRGGEAFDAVVHLQQPAPAGGLRIPLATSAPSTATVPAFVDVPAGALSVTVTVQTSAVSADQQVTLQAGLGSGAGTREFRVRS